MPLDEDVQALLNALRALEHRLEGLDDFWAHNVRKAADEVSCSDVHGLSRFLSFFGGMGSLNDLVLQRNGQVLRAQNDQLDALRSNAWNLANRLKNEVR
jgi:hypothetical protein